MSLKGVFLNKISKKKSLPFPGKLNLATKTLFLSSIRLLKEIIFPNWINSKGQKSFKLDTGFLFTKTNTKYAILFDRVIFCCLNAFSYKILASKNGTPMKKIFTTTVFER